MNATGNDEQERAEERREEERAEIKLNILKRKTPNPSRTLLKATSILVIALESKRHRAHPYKERQKEQRRNVNVLGEQNLKL